MWWTPKQAIALRQSSSGGGDETEEYELVTIKAERFDAEAPFVYAFITVFYV